MAKRIRDKKSGEIIRIEFGVEEMAETVLEVDKDQLLQWNERIPAQEGNGDNSVYYIENAAEMNLLKKRASLLKTNMSQVAVKNVEEAGLLDAYSALAEDCPPGVTAHVWRSYGLVVLMQTRYGKMIGAKELAERAGLNKINERGKAEPNIEMAEKHLRFLKALNLLRMNEEEGRWEHNGLPKSWRGA